MTEKKIKISLISKGQYFGEKELLTATPRDEKAVCKSRMCILFAFPREVHIFFC